MQANRFSEQTDKRHGCETVGFWINTAVGVATIIALIIAMVQVFQAKNEYTEGLRQFDQSGPKFSWFDTNIYVPMVSVSSTDGITDTRQASAIVVSNTGRTQDTIVAPRRNGKIDDAMTVCLPAFDSKGDLDRTSPVDIGAGIVGLAPGDSRLAFFFTRGSGSISPDGSMAGAFGDLTQRLDMITASGRIYRSQKIARVPDEITDYYSSLPGYFDAVNACNTAMQAEGR
jgi:hypothetical protein